MEKKEAYKFTGQDAEYYDHYLGPILFEPYARYLVSQINAGNIGSVLEIACGTGRVTRHLRKALPDRIKLTASDISNDMLTVARRELDNNGIEFRVEDAQALSFADNSFDLVVCQFGMMFLPDKQKGFNEICRVLKPGGQFLCFTWNDMLKIPVLKLIMNDLVVSNFDGEDTTRFFVPFSLHDPLKLQDFLKTAGFSKTNVEKVVLTSGSPSAENLVNAFLLKHMLGKEVAAKDPALLGPLAEKMEKEIAEQFESTDLSFELSAYLTTGEK